ncbi:MAG: hypothetical protein ABGX00_00660 [Allomuricauda sp.]|jgi:hypothetical protein
MIGNGLFAKHLRSLLNQYRTSENEVLRGYTINLAADYIKESIDIIAILVNKEGELSAEKTLEALEHKPDRFEESIERIIGYIDEY